MTQNIRRPNQAKIVLPKPTSVHSSSMEKMAWENDLLFVQFTGALIEGGGYAVYKYSNVPKALWELLLSINKANNVLTEPAAQVSLGRAFTYTIKKFPEKYKFEKLTLPGAWE